MKEKPQPYTGLVKAISFTLKQFRLYSDTHPITKQALQTLELETKKYFSDKDYITLGSMRKLLVVNGNITSDKDAACKDLAGEFERLAIEGLKVTKDVEMVEIKKLMTMMAMRTKSIQDQGGFKKIFDQSPLRHIQLSVGKYELVEDGQQVADDEEIGQGDNNISIEGSGGGGPPMSMADIINRIRTDKTGLEKPDAPPPNACEKIVVQMEKQPKEMAELALEGAKNAPEVENVIRRVVRFLTEGLLAFLIEQGKDISKALDKLARELEKSIEKIGGESEEFGKLKKKIPMMFEEAADDLRIQTMVGTYKKNPEDKKAVQKMAEKLFKNGDVRQRLQPSLEEEMSGAGFPAQELHGIFQKIDDKQAKKKARVTIDATELAELQSKAKRFDEELDGKVEEVKKKYEREKKIILDEKERVDSVIRNLGEGLLVVDKDGKVVMMNPAAERLLGVDKKEKMGRPVTDGLKDEQMVAMATGDLKDNGDVSKHVEVVSLNDETKRVLQTSTAVIENENGKTVGMVSVLSDVTKQKEFDEMKDEFVANVSHELRTPLVAIQKSLKLMLTQELGDINDDQKKFLDIAHRSIERLSRLINDILDVSKMESKGMQLRPKPFHAKDFLQSTIATLETWAKDKKINIAIDVPDEPVEIDADQDRLTQVITNLAGNAIKFTPENGTITFDVNYSKEGSQDVVEFGVRDTGIGISPEDQKKIFDKFTQVSLSQPQGVSSTGLGLTIAQEIVELHQGKIWVESEVGKGSRFAFKIPVVFQGVRDA